jgi:hypothetical protein
VSVAGDRGPLARLHSLIAAEQGPLADTLADTVPRGAEAFGPLVAMGERTGADPEQYSLLVESIFEGYLVHYARGRVLAPEDPDVRLLGGDYLYALGLERLARLGDLEAVAELADLISLCSQAHADATETSPPWRACAALWSAAALAIGWGAWPELPEARELVRERTPNGAEKLHIAATERARALEVESRLEQAVIAFDRCVESRLSTT